MLRILLTYVTKIGIYSNYEGFVKKVLNYEFLKPQPLPPSGGASASRWRRFKAIGGFELLRSGL